MRARRFWAALGSLALVAGVAGPSQAAASLTPLVPTTSMAALGDSITIAYDIKSLLKADPTYSWSTGTQTAVNSVSTRLRVKSPSLTAVNLAVSGAKIADLAGQANSAKLASGTELVTLLMGANDACTKTETGSTGMTSVTAFRASANAAFAALTAKGVKQVVVASIPDVYKLWQVGKGSSSARFIWGLYGICQSMLKSPTSTQQADVDRRVRVQAQVIAFNQQLEAACAAAIVACKFDGNAVYNTSFALTDISKVDYFHPSIAGQAKLADVTYRAFWPTPTP